MTSFEIVDDMIIDKHRITTETMNFLLQACITDKEAGFRHALKVRIYLFLFHSSLNVIFFRFGVE